MSYDPQETLPYAITSVTARMEILYVAELNEDHWGDGKPWQHDLWDLRIYERPVNHYPRRMIYRASWRTGLGLRKGDKPDKPDVTEVLYRFVQDAHIFDMSFLSYCDEFGFDNDSIRALSNYNKGCESARDFRQALGAAFRPLRDAIIPVGEERGW